MTAPAAAVPIAAPSADNRAAHASPGVRRFARELGVDLGRVKGTGVKGRISEEDVKALVKRRSRRRACSAGTALPAVPEVDFATFGPVEIKPLGRIQKISGPRLQAAWVNVPHVTQHDEADITELEAPRVRSRTSGETRRQADAARFHLARVCLGHRRVPALQYVARHSRTEPRLEELRAPRFRRGHAQRPRRAGDPRCRPQGCLRAARELAGFAGKARAGKLTRPRCRAGASRCRVWAASAARRSRRSSTRRKSRSSAYRAPTGPVYRDGHFVPRLMLPLSLSYDHRVIDGAEPAQRHHRAFRGAAARRVKPCWKPCRDQRCCPSSPDLGDFKDVEVIDVLVKPGDPAPLNRR